APPEELELARVALEPRGPVQLVGRPAAPRSDETRAMDPSERRHREMLVAVNPLWVVGCEYVRLDPERGQMRRELERPLHSAAARRREVHRHEEDLHAARS